MKIKLCIAGITLAACSLGFAQHHYTATEIASIARAQYQAQTVGGPQIKTIDGRHIWDVRVRNAQGTRDVFIDPMNGKVINTTPWNRGQILTTHRRKTKHSGHHPQGHAYGYYAHHKQGYDEHHAQGRKHHRNHSEQENDRDQMGHNEKGNKDRDDKSRGNSQGHDNGKGKGY